MARYRKKRRRRRRGRGIMDSSMTKRKRTSSGRGIASVLKSLSKFAAANAPTILKGARYLAGKSGNKNIRRLANSSLLDTGAEFISKRFGGRGAMKINAVRRQAKSVVAKLIKLYGREGARKIIATWIYRKSTRIDTWFDTTIKKKPYFLRSIYIVEKN